MTNVSKQKLNKKVEVDIFDYLTGLITSADTKTSKEICFALLTPAERIMLAKRLSAIALLGSGVSRYRVAKTLHLSETTVSKYLEQLEGGMYTVIGTSLRKKEFDWKAFWETVEKISRGGLPPMDGRRWQSLNSGR